MFTFGWLTVTTDDLGVWSRFPDAVFTLVKIPGGENGDNMPEEFHLGAFEILGAATPPRREGER